MILELDIGNSRIKWRQLDDTNGTTLALGIASDIEELETGAAAATRPGAIRLCSVRRDDSVEAVQRWVNQQWDLHAEVARVTRRCGGVTNQYADVSRLGVDRWLAMLAAYQRAAGACIVVDGGTALTIDAVAEDGRHLGGYILPGLQLMTSALEANTGIRLRDHTRSAATAPGHSTDEAVLNGTLAAVVALLGQTAELVDTGAKPIKLYFSGGDAGLLKESSGFDRAEIVPELVLDGLGIACPLPAE